jgi:hypothetical protein
MILSSETFRSSYVQLVLRVDYISFMWVGSFRVFCLICHVTVYKKNLVIKNITKPSVFTYGLY